MAITVRVPTQLRSLTNGVSEVTVNGENVGEALADLGDQFPGLSDRIFDDSGAIRRFVNIFLADEDVRFLDGPQTKVSDSQVISIVPAVAGGAF
ncbi:MULTISPECIES: MoaD/ThiS family protein [Acidithrix]|uniref:Sulfur carrier protein CysO n=1 Tax=Acidithrix ferrooxidans TaxID=1280514 RepID=A0A0D8HJS7_9ACTN|nr:MULTISPECIES: MoaD/ThiS family protein [Acidithrix]KJF17987.1 sulfur carrier protein CysO [Acidithrix ferrooxidans]CAG4918028.1 unnamed protein product [Acidithrix sp. C25]